MKINNKLFECSLGIHEYTIPDKNNPPILICKHCKKFGYYKNNDGYEAWYKYDNKGNRIHSKSSSGLECWIEYNDKGNIIYLKDNKGRECWLHKGKWVTKKPKNWEYENIVKEKINEKLHT